MFSIVIFALISYVFTEGYFCPYTVLGYEDSGPEIIFDKYETQDDGATWVRLGQIGRIGWAQYCGEKSDEEKCQDSVGLCFWENSECKVNSNRVPDCFELCETILNVGGLSCLGGTCGSRETIYAICEDAPAPSITTTLTKPRCTPRK